MDTMQSYIYTQVFVNIKKHNPTKSSMAGDSKHISCTFMDSGHTNGNFTNGYGLNRHRD